MSNEKNLFDDMMDFIDAKFQADETNYSEVIGALATLKTMYKAQWQAICNEMADDDDEECQCGCCKVESKDVPKLQ